MSDIIYFEDATDRWKWVCPNGHCNWEPTNHHFWCETCARSYDTDGVFDALRNMVTGDIHDRDLLLTPNWGSRNREWFIKCTYDGRLTDSH